MADEPVATKKELLALRVIVSALINTVHNRETLLQNHLIEAGYTGISAQGPGVKHELFEQVKILRDLPEYKFDPSITKIIDHILNDI